jgi:tetratricopeptide (TPR) repeat protein
VVVRVMRDPGAALAGLVARDRASADRATRPRRLKERAPASGLVPSDRQTAAPTGCRAHGFHLRRRLIATLRCSQRSARRPPLSLSQPQRAVGTTPRGSCTDASAGWRSRAAHATTSDLLPARVSARPPTPVSLARATNLEARGHTLHEAGRYANAVEVLERALLASGEHLSACLKPGSDRCVTYGYALHDLRRALRLSGRPTAAVPILEHRLEIDNQRPTVEPEFALARQQAAG